MITVSRYTAKFQKDWNAFVAASANGTFILDRGYMDYHKQRFSDHSLLIFQNNSLAAIFPANEKTHTVFSHGGLTYGGLIAAPGTKLITTLTIFHALLEYYNRHGVTKLFYKPVPFFFHTTPFHQDLYGLFLLKSVLTVFNTGFITDLTRITIPKDGRYMIAKAKKHGVKIVRAPNCTAFWSEILVPHLKKRFNTAPVHAIEEIELLRSQFPDHILQYNAVIHKTIVSGVTVFLDRGVAHCQYIAGTDMARRTGANDCLLWHLITKTFKNQKFFSLGTTNMASPDGRTLSRGLVRWKEGFGATMAPYPCYTIETKNYRNLEIYI